MDTFGIWVAAFVNLAIWSYLLKDNPLYKVVEHLFIGISAGHALVMGWGSVKSLAWKPAFDASSTGDQRLLAALSLAMGLLLYARFFKQYRVIGALPIGILLGTGAGLSLGSTVISQGIAQVRATILPLTSVNNVVIVVGVLATMCYFLYTKLEGAPGRFIAGASLIGRYMMMIGLGAAYGNTVMGRVALLTGRLTFLFRDWLGILK